MLFRKLLLSCSVVSLGLALGAPAFAVECSGVETKPWINEIDYDDIAGGIIFNNDREEFVEIAGPAGTDLAGLRLLQVEGNPSALSCGTGVGGSEGGAYFDSPLINAPIGSGGSLTPYGNGTTVLPDDGNGIGFFVICIENTSTVRESAQVCDAIVPGIAGDSNLKNGDLIGDSNCADGVLVLDPIDTFVDAVNWEGDMPATPPYGTYFQSPQYNAGEDPGFDSLQSLYKNDSTLARATSAGQWTLSAEGGSTPGAANPGQSLVCVLSQDADGDGVDDPDDNCPAVPNPGQEDTDGDGVGDACNDADDADGDEYADVLDNCPSDANPGQVDTDGDGVGDACNDADDADGDEYADAFDNCPGVSNPGQQDTDLDGIGDACNDADDADGDEWADALDNCPATGNPGQEDADVDGLGDLCDNCPSVSNASQDDTDLDGVGDACNDADDADGDEWADALDNCPNDPNPGQEDSDDDGIGDACDTVGGGPALPAPVPALQGTALTLLGMLVAGAGALAVRRRRRR